MEAIVHSSMEAPVAASMIDPDIVRSWKDPRYRRSLSAQQLQTLPEHPSGSAMLSHHELKVASGLMDAEDEFAVVTTNFACTLHTFGSWKQCGC